MTVLATDLFSVDGQIDDGVNWNSNTDSTWTAASGICKITSGSLSSDWFVDYIGATWPADQYAQITLSNPAASGAGTGYGVAVRLTAVGAAGTFYRLVGNASGYELTRFASGNFMGTIASGTSTTFANGDTLRLEISGTTLKMYKNGVQFGGNQTDANIATGHAGMAYSSTEGTTPGIDAFEGGDFAGGGGTVNTQTLTDTLAIADTSIASAIRGSYNSDTISISDLGITSAVRGRLLEDVIAAVIDALGGYPVRGRLGEDTVAVTDEAVLFYRRNRLLEDAIVVTDELLASIVGNNILARVLSDSIVVTDGTVWSAIRGRILQDTITISEGAGEFYTTTNMVVDDEILVDDANLARRWLTRLLTDSVNVTDEAIASIIGQNVLTRLLTDTITTVDEAVLFCRRHRLGESMVLTTDEVVKVLQWTRQLTDAVELSDQPLTALQRFILLSDALSVDDSATVLFNPAPDNFVTPLIRIGFDQPLIRIGFDQPRIEIGGYSLT